MINVAHIVALDAYGPNGVYPPSFTQTLPLPQTVDFQQLFLQSFSGEILVYLMFVFTAIK
jgi:hypothetical protein